MRGHFRAEAGRAGHLRETWLDLSGSLGRSVVTVLSVAIGTGLLVGTLGLARSAQEQVEVAFDALNDNAVAVEGAPGELPGDEPTLPWDAPVGALRLGGATAAANLTDLDSDLVLQGSPLGEGVSASIKVAAATPELPAAVHAQIVGQFLNAWHEQVAARVVVLGAGAAAQLGVRDLSTKPVIIVDEVPLTVIGVIADGGSQQSLLTRAVVPQSTARAEFGLHAPTKLYVATAQGAAPIVARKIAVAVNPRAAEALHVVVAQPPTVTRQAVNQDLERLLLLLAGLTLVISTIAITNAMLITVWERSPEIGLRRALGASEAQVRWLFLLEAGLLGVVGGLIGLAGGLLVVSTVSLAQGWAPVLEPWVPVMAPAVGAAVGLVAGLLPARRAAKLEPIAALRRLS